MSSTQAAVEAVRKSLFVECSPERAFEVFTREIGAWWPTQSYSIGQRQDHRGRVRAAGRRARLRAALRRRRGRMGPRARVGSSPTAS